MKNTSWEWDSFETQAMIRKVYDDDAIYLPTVHLFE